MSSAARALTAVFAFGAVALTALVLAGFVPIAALVYRNGDAARAQTLYDLTFGLLAQSGIPTALCMGAYTLVVREHGRLPPWTAALAAAGAIAHLAIAASFLSGRGLFSLEGKGIVWVPFTLFLWVLGTSVALLRARLDR